MSIMTIRTTIGRENVVMTEIEDRMRSQKLAVRALLHPEKLKGYILIDGDDDDVKTAIRGLRHVNGLIDKPVSLDQIKHFMETKKPTIEMNRGDIIEIIGGPFKRERGKITAIDQAKGEVTVELLEAAVPIPVTISSDSVRLLEKAKDVIEESKQHEQEKAEE